MPVYKVPLLLEPQPEGGYTVTSPVIPELVTEGETVQDALRNAGDALEAVLSALRQLGRPLPVELSTNDTAVISVETAVAVS